MHKSASGVELLLCGSGFKTMPKLISRLFHNVKVNHNPFYKHIGNIDRKLLILFLYDFAVRHIFPRFTVVERKAECFKVFHKLEKNQIIFRPMQKIARSHQMLNC